MKIEHLALGYNSEKEADKFFINLLGLNKVRTKTVPLDLMEAFFKVKRSHTFIRYRNQFLNFEVFITDDMSKANDSFTHICLIVENREKFTEKAVSMGYDVIKVPRKDSPVHYLFIRDSFYNLYEIIEQA
ncbi:MAG: VOC family protein [Promethearchaeota archaeon]|nr:MAG: VOC family protein [Candidatus Lokiarchaeota archaeon]